MIELAQSSPALFIGVACSVLVLAVSATRRRKAPLPPGPKPLPIIGNILDIPQEKAWLKFAEWGQRWGDIISLSIIGPQKTMIVLNSLEEATDLLDKKGSNYSDRPTLAMCGELMGWDNAAGMSPYNDVVRSHRKEMHQFMGTPPVISEYHPEIEAETRNVMSSILKDPVSWEARIRRAPGAVILRLVYGYQVTSDDDPLITLADKVLAQFSLAASPGAFMVDLMPALRWVPEWMPGAGFKKKARQWKKDLHEMLDAPFNYVSKEVEAGRAQHSYVGEILSSGKMDDEHLVKWVALGMYSGAADTTVASLISFFLAMTKYPEAMKKAQAEIDAVIGPNRLPSFKDRADLPYVNALVKEVSRWHLAAPLGLPHRSREDDIHKGYFIPAGSLVIVNVWKILHDPTVYKHPHDFRPERFLGPNPEPDPAHAIFGFGRRVCSGRLLADATIFMTAAMTLAAFDISKPIKNGKPVEPVLNPASGIISHPGPFSCNITPRSGKTAQLLAMEEL